jgi:hypothetical protein
MELSRYKYVVNVVIGEMKGEGVRLRSRYIEWLVDVFGTLIRIT